MSITDNIVSKELESLGVVAPVKTIPQTQELPPFEHSPRQTKLKVRKAKVVEYGDNFDTKFRREDKSIDDRHVDHLSLRTTEIVSPRLTKWTKDGVTDQLSKIAMEAWECSGPDAVIARSDVRRMVSVLTQDFESAMLTAGFMCTDLKAKDELSNLLTEFLLTKCRMHNGKMFRYVCVEED
jgi:hypothetical protein